MGNTILSSVKFLKRLPLYKEEKPFKIVFDISDIDGAQKTNHEFESREIKITDAQDSRDTFSLSQNGFEIHNWPSSLQSIDFDDPAIVAQRYYPEVIKCVKKFMPEIAECHVLNYQRRKRGANFPASATYDTPTRNPVVYAHADFSTNGAQVRMAKFFQENPHLQLEDYSYQLVNVWRVTRGPNTDWPLAICDYQTLEVDNDVELCDVIHRDHVGENVMIYYSPNQRWYYLKNQSEDDILLFRHTVSQDTPHLPFGGHVAFETPGNVPEFLRESIEVKVACFYKR